MRAYLMSRRTGASSRGREGRACSRIPRRERNDRRAPEDDSALDSPCGGTASIRGGEGRFGTAGTIVARGRVRAGPLVVGLGGAGRRLRRFAIGGVAQGRVGGAGAFGM